MKQKKTKEAPPNGFVPSVHCSPLILIVGFIGAVVVVVVFSPVAWKAFDGKKNGRLHYIATPRRKK